MKRSQLHVVRCEYLCHLVWMKKKLFRIHGVAFCLCSEVFSRNKLSFLWKLFHISINDKYLLWVELKIYKIKKTYCSFQLFYRVEKRDSVTIMSQRFQSTNATTGQPQNPQQRYPPPMPQPSTMRFSTPTPNFPVSRIRA